MKFTVGFHSGGKMKRCSLFCAGIWPFLLLPLILLALVLFFRQGIIESDVAENASANLIDKGFRWVEITTFNRGRDMLISGTAPNQEAVNSALQVVRRSKGVRIAEFAGRIQPKQPTRTVIQPASLVAPNFSSIVSGDSISLEGALASPTAINDVVEQAAKVFGSSKVVNKMVIDNSLADLPLLPGFFAAIKGKAIGTLKAHFKDDVLVLQAELPDQEIKNNLLATAKALWGNQVIDELTIAPQVESSTCQNLLESILNKGEIHFETGSSVISTSSYSLLAEIASTSRRCANAIFEVSGHTDSTGSLPTNMQLSQARAQAVVAYLVNLGLDARRFNAIGYGPSRPIADNSTADGRAQNRRIEFKLQNQ